MLLQNNNLWTSKHSW